MRALTIGLAGALLLIGASSAGAAEPKLQTKFGMSAMIGGGVTGFTDTDVVDMTTAGGSWTARVVLGTRLPVGFEAAYVGTAQEIDTLNLDANTILMSNGVEGAVRLNVLQRGYWQPYIFAGLAFKQYDLVNSDFNTSSVLDKDAVAEVPLGAGLAFRYEGIVADARFAFHPAFDSELIPGTVAGEGLRLNNWNANLRIGWEF